LRPDVVIKVCSANHLVCKPESEHKFSCTLIQRNGSRRTFAYSVLDPTGGVAHRISVIVHHFLLLDAALCSLNVPLKLMWVEGAHTGFPCSCYAAKSNMKGSNCKVKCRRSVPRAQSRCTEWDLHKACTLQNIHVTKLALVVKPLEFADGGVPSCIDHNYNIRSS